MATGFTGSLNGHEHLNFFNVLNILWRLSRGKSLEVGDF